MKHLHHPSELNPLRLYQQAKLIAKRSSRAENPDWYLQPFAIQRQWHLWFDGEAVVSVLFDQSAKRWVKGPALSWPGKDGGDGAGQVVGSLGARKGIGQGEREELHAALAEALRSRELGGKVKSLGVVLHVADEFAVVDPAREYSSMVDFDRVQEILQEDPKEVLGDSTIDPLLNTWRLLPCWGMKEGRLNMAVQMGRRREAFFSEVRGYGEDNNIAIVATGVSAALVTLRLAPLYLEWDETRGRGDIIVMMYRRFSAMAVLDEDGELTLLRSLAHRAGMEYPTGLGEILVNTRTSAALENPVVTILPMVGGRAQEQVAAELTSFFSLRAPMDIGFNELDQMEVAQAIPGQRIEMLSGDGVGLEALLENKPLNGNRTFTGLSARWAMQDFFPVGQAEAEKYPTWQELRMWKWFRGVRIALLVLVLAMGAWGGMKVVRTVSSEAWQAPSLDPTVAAMGMAKLVKEQKQLDYWESIMKNRSPGWLVMQLMLDLFPEDSGLVMTDCSYSIQGERQDRGSGSGEQANALGFTRQWEIEGFAHATALPSLIKLGSNAFMRNLFDGVANEYQAPDFKMTVPGRTMNVTLQRQQKSYPIGGVLGKDGEKYTTSFTLVIRQGFPADDDLAIPMESGASVKKDGK